MPDSDRLESWKEIAAYLGREVRTVQGWEKNEGLPVHRQQHTRQGSVYAFKPELDAWREARKANPAEPEALEAPLPGKPKPWGAVLAAAAVVALVVGFWLWRSRADNPPGPALASVVVLPFLDLSPQKDQEYFTDGLTEELIDALSRVPNLRVVARTSAFVFKGKANDVRQIGKQLNVDAVLEGSVRKSGDDLRITAQLNRVSDGTHFWSRTYDRKLHDIFALQREVSQNIAAQLRTGNVPPVQATTNLEAYARYQEGLYFFNQHEVPESYWKAIERYQEAIKLDPNYARAYAGMADAYAYLAENFAVAPKEIFPKAKAAAEKAVALDDNSAEAHVSRGVVMMDFEWDQAGGSREFQRALQLNPGLGWARHWNAHALEAQDRLEDATKEMRAALDLDPLSIPIHWDIANELMAAGKFDEAAKFLDHAEELFPGYPIIEWQRAEAYYRNGNPDGAIRVARALLQQNPDLVKLQTFLVLKGTVDVWEGHRAEAKKTLDELDRMRQSQYVESALVLELCSELGDRQQLMKWTRRLVEDRSTMFLYLPMASFLYNNDSEVKAYLASISGPK